MKLIDDEETLVVCVLVVPSQRCDISKLYSHKVVERRKVEVYGAVYVAIKNVALNRLSVDNIHFHCCSMSPRL